MSTTRGIYGWLQAATYVGWAALAYYGMWIRPTYYGLSEQFGEVLTEGRWQENPLFPLKRSYIGIAYADGMLTFLDAAFMSGIARFHKGFWMLQVYFLGLLLQPIAIWAVESFRKRNYLSLISFVSVWSYIYQTNGIAILMPLWYVAYTKLSAEESYWSPLSREVPQKYSKALLPALLLGYGLPTALMFWPWSDPATIQDMTAFWQPSPIYVQILVVGFAFVYDQLYPEDKQSKMAGAEPVDMRDLNLVYGVTFVAGVMLHVGVIAKLLTSSDPQLTIGTTFIPDWRVGHKVMGEGLRNMWLVDFYVFFGASISWCCYAVWDLKRIGKTNVGVWEASARICAANILVGPGAAMVGCWYWRERAMARTLKPKKSS